MTMKELNRDICGIVAMAKAYKGMTDADIAEACNMSATTLQHKRSYKELPLLSYWNVTVIARLAGYRVEFVPEGRK